MSLLDCTLSVVNKCTDGPSQLNWRMKELYILQSPAALILTWPLSRITVYYYTTVDLLWLDVFQVPHLGHLELLVGHSPAKQNIRKDVVVKYMSYLRRVCL